MGPMILRSAPRTGLPDATARPVPNLGLQAIYRNGAEPQADKAKAAAAKQAETNPNYFRCISAADDNLGRLLKTLDELGLAEDTVVVFASDNGYYKGEHGLGDKRSAYEESLRIPLILRYPKLIPKAKVQDEMVLNIDLAPTFLELAGLSVPSTMQGRSWRPLLTGKAGDWRKCLPLRVFPGERFSRHTDAGWRPHGRRQTGQVSRPRRMDGAVRPQEGSV